MENSRMEFMKVIADVFDRPPIPFNPELQSLKGWAMYCLRDRGFKVIYAQNADFAVENRNEKVYFNVTETTENLTGNVAWIVHDRASQRTRLIAPQP